MSDPGNTAAAGDGGAPAGPGAAVAGRLESRTVELTRRWHEELESRLRVRPHNVFPGSDLLDGMPELIRWVCGALANGRELREDQVRRVRDLADYWRRSGYSVEESLAHVRILGGILHEALREEIAELEGVPGVGGAAVAERLCGALSQTETVLVGQYRDEEETRFAEFGGTLAHEIRGDLATAMASAEVLRVLDGDGPEAAEKRSAAIERITEAVERASGVVDAVRTFSRARAGLGEFTMAPLPGVVEEVVGHVRREAAGRVNLEIVDEIPDVTVPSEAVRLALHNLVQNAVTHADEAKSERWTRIHCRRDADRRHWVIQVGDNGQGIPEDEQERIFSRFLRGRGAESEGFGLGLSIARQAILAIGGAVMLEWSERGEGSTFSITIPFAAAGD